MQATKFLNSLIIEKNLRDDVWIELRWNSVVEQMWKGFKLTKTEKDEINDYMEKQRKGMIAQGFQQDRMFELDNYWGLCGWNVCDYTMSVNHTFDRIKQLLS